jgi:hypothetical protein
MSDYEDLRAENSIFAMAILRWYRARLAFVGQRLLEGVGGKKTSTFTELTHPELFKELAQADEILAKQGAIIAKRQARLEDGLL